MLLRNRESGKTCSAKLSTITEVRAGVFVVYYYGLRCGANGVAKYS